jgi:hypothetical protein
VADLERKETERANAARIVEDVADTAGRYKETVARLTADNMIFLMKVMLESAHGTLISWLFTVSDQHRLSQVNAEFRFDLPCMGDARFNLRNYSNPAGDQKNLNDQRVGEGRVCFGNRSSLTIVRLTPDNMIIRLKVLLEPMKDVLVSLEFW